MNRKLMLVINYKTIYFFWTVDANHQCLFNISRAAGTRGKSDERRKVICCIYLSVH